MAYYQMGIMGGITEEIMEGIIGMLVVHEIIDNEIYY
tara:strand:- start:22 stop:132 length:111 start_codon:yes stop_codon:yes gene_type:complete